MARNGEEASFVLERDERPLGAAIPSDLQRFDQRPYTLNVTLHAEVAEDPVRAAGANPCIWPAAPSIKYNGKYKVELGSGRVSFVGDVSSYPAIEAVAGYNGIYKSIFRKNLSVRRLRISLSPGR
jgi:hypothetical protein